MSLLSHTRLAGKPQFSRYVGRSSRGCRYSASCEKRQVPMTVTRSIAILAVATAAAVPLLGGCAGSDSNQADSAQQQQDSPGPGKSGERGPMFPECGGISDETMAEQTRVTGLVKTAVNSVGCQWLVAGGILGPHFSFTWFRGSPIGRERKTQELSRTSVEDITVEGRNGFVAVGTDPMLGDNLCEVGIGFGDDFIEWSVSFADKSFPPPCDVAIELTRQSIVNAK